MRVKNRFGEGLLLALLLSVVGIVTADTRSDTLKEIENTKSQSQRINEENAALQAKIEELEALASEHGASAKDLDQSIQLIKAKLVTEKPQSPTENTQ